ncbi:MAG: ATP-binding protein, partial [Thermodesulfobacteriota bacterium]|nr:ATP-binding protein [Thermodesulfobacteriota bacterium]
SRQTEEELKPVIVKPIVKEALKLIRASLPTTIEIQQDIQSDFMTLGDPTQIHQVLMNLCTNAGHAMEEKGGILRLELVDVEIDSEFTKTHPGMYPGPYIKLTVSDTGRGMSPHVLDRIFDPFFTTKEKGAGTGMGLSVVHGIVKSYGGSIYASGKPGEGSTFQVFFPAIEEKPETNTEVENPIPRGSQFILFVDDEPPLADMGKQLLESLGYKVTVKTSSFEALELFKEQPDKFDLVITDMTMPNMTGDKLAKEIMSVRSNMPVILCTGFSSKITEDDAKRIGIRAFVSKPVLKREIGETIFRVLCEE